jgi:hypothetical protein
MSVTLARVNAVSAAVKAVAADCETPVLATLTGADTRVTARREALPGGPLTADAIAPALAGMARLIARHPAMFRGTDVCGYAVILPGERVAFVADRDGTTYHVQLPGKPTESLRPDRWDAMIDAVRAMTGAI